MYVSFNVKAGSCLIIRNVINMLHGTNDIKIVAVFSFLITYK